MSTDDPPPGLFEDSLTAEVDDVMAGGGGGGKEGVEEGVVGVEETSLQFVASSDQDAGGAAKIVVNSEFQKVMDSIADDDDMSNDDVDDKLLKFVSGLDKEEEEEEDVPVVGGEAETEAEAEASIGEAGGVDAGGGSDVITASESSQSLSSALEAAVGGGEVATGGGGGDSLGLGVERGGSVVVAAAAVRGGGGGGVEETPEETMQVERLMESIHNGGGEGGGVVDGEEDEEMAAKVEEAIGGGQDEPMDVDDGGGKVGVASEHHQLIITEAGSLQLADSASASGLELSADDVTSAADAAFIQHQEATATSSASSKGGGEMMTSLLGVVGEGVAGEEEEEAVASVEDVLSALHSQFEGELLTPNTTGASREEAPATTITTTTIAAPTITTTSTSTTVTIKKAVADKKEEVVQQKLQPQQCFVTGCKVGAEAAQQPSLRFFKPPPNPLIFKRWARNLCQGSQMLSYNAHICERHFRPGDIREVFVNGKKKWVLNEGAVPKPAAVSASLANASGNATDAAASGKRPVGRPSGLYRQQQFEAQQIAASNAIAAKRAQEAAAAAAAKLKAAAVDGEDGGAVEGGESVVMATAAKEEQAVAVGDVVKKVDSEGDGGGGVSTTQEKGEDEKTSPTQLLYTLAADPSDTAAAETEIVDPKALSDNPDVLKGAMEDLSELDVLVCGICHTVFHFVEKLVAHKAKANCRGTSTFKASMSESKPHVWAFLLWKNAQNKVLGETESSWKLYQRWCRMPDTFRDAWIAAGKSMQGTSLMLSHLKMETSNAKNGKTKTSAIYAALEDDDDAAMTKDSLAGGDSTSKMYKKPGRKKNADEFEVKTEKKPDFKSSFKDEKPFIGGSGARQLQPSGVGVGETSEEFLVEKIVSRRYNQKRKEYEYLLKWEGYPPEQNTWEPAQNMSTCQHLLHEFEANLAKMQGGGTKVEAGDANSGPVSPPRFNSTGLMGPKKLAAAIAADAVTSNDAATPTVSSSGRPVRSSKQKALDQVKQWCGSMIRPNDLEMGGVAGGGGMPGGGGGGVKRRLDGGDSDDDDEMWADADGEGGGDGGGYRGAVKRFKSEHGGGSGKGTPVWRGGMAARARAQLNGMKRESSLAAVLGLESSGDESGGDGGGGGGGGGVRTSSLSPQNQQVLVASAKGVVKVDPSQVPNLTSGVYIMSNKSGIVKLDSVTPNSAISSLQKKGLLKSSPGKGGVIMLGSKMGGGASGAGGGAKSGIIRRTQMQATTTTTTVTVAMEASSGGGSSKAGGGAGTVVTTALVPQQRGGVLKPGGGTSTPRPGGVVRSAQSPAAQRLSGVKSSASSFVRPRAPGTSAHALVRRPQQQQSQQQQQQHSLSNMLKSGIKPIESMLGAAGATTTTTTTTTTTQKVLQQRKRLGDADADEVSSSGGTPKRALSGSVGGTRPLKGGGGGVTNRSAGGIGGAGRSSNSSIRSALSSLGFMDDLDEKDSGVKLEMPEESSESDGIPDDFPIGELPPIGPESPPRPLTLCPLTGKVLSKAEGERTPEPTPPHSPHDEDESSAADALTASATQIVQIQSASGGQKVVSSASAAADAASAITVDAVSSGSGRSGADPAVAGVGGGGGGATSTHIIKVEMSSKEAPANVQPATVSVRKVPARTPRAKSNTGRSRGGRGAAAAAAASAASASVVSAGASTTSLGTITVPARKIFHHHQPEAVGGGGGDEEDAGSHMVTITGDDGMLYQVSNADLTSAAGNTLLVEGEDGQQCVYVTTADGVGVGEGVVGGAEGEGTTVLTLDSAYADAVAQLIPEQFYVKEGESGAELVSLEGGGVVMDGGGGVVVAAEDGVEVEEGEGDDDQNGQVVAQLVEAGEPSPGGGPRRVVLLLPDGNLMMTEVDEEQYAALELDK